MLCIGDEYMTKYADIKIPEPLAKGIDKEIKQNPEQGFRSRAEYIISLIRRELNWNKNVQRSRAEFKEKFGIEYNDRDAIRKLPKAKKMELIEHWNQNRTIDYY